MQNRLAVFLVNLKPAKMRGVMSEGMIMCASSPDKVEIIEPPNGVVIGDHVTVEGYSGILNALTYEMNFYVAMKAGHIVIFSLSLTRGEYDDSI